MYLFCIIIINNIIIKNVFKHHIDVMFSDDFYSVNLYLIYKHCLVKILKYSVSCEIELIYVYSSISYNTLQYIWTILNWPSITTLKRLYCAQKHLKYNSISISKNCEYVYIALDGIVLFYVSSTWTLVT